MRATIDISLRKDNGVTVSRSVNIESSIYLRESQKAFKNRVRRQASAALNSVLGAPDGLKVEDASK